MSYPRIFTNKAEVIFLLAIFRFLNTLHLVLNLIVICCNFTFELIVAEQIPLYSRNLAKHILEQMDREENKHKTVGFQSTNQESVTRCIRSYTPALLKPCVVT